jgi:large repetitive protein
MKILKLIVLLFSLSSAFGQNSLLVRNLNAGPGEETKIIIGLDNTDKVAGFQFTLKLPNSLIVKEKEVKFIQRNTNHVIYPKNNGNGEYLFLCFSASNDNFTGNSGDLLEIPVEIPLSYTTGQTYNMTLSEVELSSALGQDIGSNHKNGLLTIIEGKNPDLKVDNINFTDTQITPDGKFSVKWNIQNIGKSAAIGGWTEQVYLVSQVNGKKYLIGNSSYGQNLVENQSVSREAEFNIPSIIGFDGDVKIEVVVIPNLSVKEPDYYKANNTLLSTQKAFLLRKIIFTIDRTRILRNSNDLVRVYLTRSGDIAAAEEFTLTSNENQYFDLPQKITLAQNQSSNFAYISVKPTTAYEGDKEIKLTVTGNSYSDQTATFTLVEDKKISLSIEYPANFSSVIGSKILFTLNANYDNNVDKTIKLSSDNSKRIQLPADVVLKAGQKTVTFEGTIIDPGIVDKKVKVILYATTMDYVPASKEINLNSVNIPTFELILAPNTVSEGDGIKATYATLKRTSQIDKEVIVEFSASPNDRLILPSAFVFKKGEGEKIFNIGTIDNAIVEGDQTVNVFSKVKFLDCNCIDQTDLTTVTKQDVKIIDNDGLAIVLSASPSTIKAGAINNTLKIARNTTDPNILKDPVTVTLSNNLPSVVELPATVTIAANQKEITISFSTKIDAALIGDQNARIEGKATNYNVGYAWVLITDQNKPDVIVSGVTLPTQVEAGKKVIIKTAILNQGYANFKSGSKIDYFLSPNNSTSGLTPFNSSILTKEIKVGETYNYTEEVQLPVLSGKLNLIVVANADNSISELVTTNNQNLQLVDFLPAYTVTVTLDKKVYKPSEKVIISGVAKTLGGALVPISDVEITVKTKDFSRTFKAKTNTSGVFVYEFTPLANESGNYSVKAAYPGADVSPQATFDILGFEIVNKPQYIKWEPYVNFPLGKDFVLKNNSSIKLTGVKINLPDNTDFELQQIPIDIQAGQQISLGYTIIANKPSTENKYTEITISITSNEGAELKETIYYFSKSKQANLIAEPISINTTMAKGMVRLYEFTVKNIGDVDATNIEVLLPTVDWMSLKSSKIIEKIEAGKEAKVVLNLEPTVKEQINVPISGSLVIKGANSNGLSVPFRIETVSDSKGKLVIDATDEYTYNTASAPHLAGAKVVVKLPFSGAVVAEGVTNAAGLFEIPTINEGYYTVSVEADKHNPFQNNILVDPGKTTNINAFLPYKAITYSWQVVPTEITDQYDIHLVAQFETNVPKPVVVMTLDNPKLDLEVGQSRLVNLTITNHGLIAANEIKIGVSNIPGYEIKPLIETMDVLNAKTTVVVPVMLRRVSLNKSDLALNDQSISKPDDTCFSGYIDLSAYYLCDTKKPIFEVTPFEVTLGCPQPVITDPTPIGPIGPIGPVGCVLFCGDGGPYSGQSTVTSFPDICDPCTNAIISTILSCNPYTTTLSCIFGILTSTSLVSLGANGVGCFSTPFACAYSICNISSCFGSQCFLSKGRDEIEKLDGPKGKWDYIFEDFEKVTNANTASHNMISEYVKNSNLENNEIDFPLFLKEVNNQLDNEKIFTPAEIIIIKENLKNTSVTEAYIDSFVTRWNTTIIAWNSNIFSPNAQYPNIVDKVKIKAYKATKEGLKAHAFARGFVSPLDMYQSDLKAIDDFQKEKANDGASVCATVTIDFPQKLTMTRQAFEGTLTINNSSSKDIKDINLDLIVKDELGVDKSNLFQINKDAFLNGTGIVTPDTKGKGVAIFIPTKEAAPMVKKSYSFGGILSYFDVDRNERVNITLNPVTLEVNPSPDLILDYFLQRDIIADDALTEDIVEPSIPAELSLMISNDGFGLAKNVNVESMQPKIVDNKKGLAIDFNMIGSNFNNEPRQLGLLAVNFGNIEPKSSAIGQWFFTSSLLGHFVKYDIKVNHTSSFGNASLSLIKGYYVHELIKSVKAFEAGNDNISDFLVNDNADAYDTPDRIYLSNGKGSSEEVLKAESVESSNNISASNLTTKVTIKPVTTGWHYGNIMDPGGKQYKLTKIIRDKDNVEIPLANFWQTPVTLKDGLNPKYENKLHVLDKISQINTYTLYFVPRDENTPTIVAIEDAPAGESTAIPVELLKVKFNKEIDVNTFTANNIKLIHQGVTLPSTSIMIGKIDATTYSINIKDLTKVSGYYELTVSSVGIKDLLGNEGANAKRVTWLQFLNELGILKFQSDQVKKQPLNSINVTFNKQIRTEEFTTDKITLNDNLVSNLMIKKVDDFNYAISGINSSNQDNADYTIAIDLPKITAVDGSKGLAMQSFKWKVDNNIPKVVKLQPQNQGGLNAQNITEIDLLLNRKLTNILDASALKFSKNGQQINIPVTIQKVDDLNYKILGLTDYTKDNGNYRLIIDQSTLKDENDNIGEGIAEVTWVVKLNALNGLSSLKITPDRGSSITDNITSGDDVELIYKTLEDNLTVEVYELQATSEVLLFKNTRDIAGQYNVSLKGRVGAKRFKVIATDVNGNKSNPEIISSYIDFTNIISTIENVKTTTISCYDFDTVNVTFSDDITENTFTKDAITLKSSGIVIPKDNVIVKKVSDKNYSLENIQYDKDGLITLEIDKSKISKKLSGLAGIQTDVKEIGAPNKYAVTVTGTQNPNVNEVYTYTATTKMKKYDWIIVNGEIIGTSDNTVIVKWNKLGEQSLVLRYQTPLECTAAIVKNVNVIDGTLGVDNNFTADKKIVLAPVPNDGEFSIQTNTALYDCTIDIYNMFGQLVHQEKNITIDKNVKNINATNLHSGTYILIIHNKNEKLDFKFVIK